MSNYDSGFSRDKDVLFQLKKGEIPFSLDAEFAVLGALLIAPDNQKDFIDIRDILKPDDFFGEINVLIAKAMWVRFDRKQTVDPITINARYHKRADIKKEFEKSDGDDFAAFLARLVLNAPAAGTAIHLSQLVADLSARRKMMEFGQGIMEVATDPDTDKQAYEIYEEQRQDFEGLRSEFAVTSQFVELGDAMHDALDEIGSVGTMGFTTSIPELDRVVGGFHRGDLIILGARPRMGKTALAMQMMRERAATPVEVEVDGVRGTRKANVLFFSLEMKAGQVGIRSASAWAYQAEVADIPYKAVFDGKIEPYEKDILLSQVPYVKEHWPIHIDHSSGLTSSEIIARCRSYAKKHGPLDMVVVDYAQRLSWADTAAKNEHLGINQALVNFADFAKDEALSFILLSQLTREPDRREGNIPMISDLRGSGGYEEHATIIMLLVRHEVYLNMKALPKNNDDLVDHMDEIARAANKAVIYVGKNKRGGEEPVTFDARVAFDSFGPKAERHPIPRDE